MRHLRVQMQGTYHTGLGQFSRLSVFSPEPFGARKTSAI